MSTATNRDVSRRQVLRRGGQVLATGTGATLVTSTAAAEHREPYDEQPEHIELHGYGNADGELDTYRPWLDLTDLEIRPTKLYCWRATSSLFTERCYCYWCWYPEGQTGFSSEDSHVPDREPVYVFVNSDDTVDRIVFDRYHYLVGVNVSPPTYLETHPTLRVIAPWHPYRTTTTVGSEAPELDDLHDIYSGWLANGWTVDEESVLDPWHVERRGHWWPSEFQAFQAELAADLGLHRLAPGVV